MKARKILALSMALATVATASTVAFALELDQDSPKGNSEITANIQSPGAINYTVTIPDKVDFGTLTQPETDTDSFKDVNFEVKLTTIENLPLRSRIAVYVKDQNATVDDDLFYITQKTSPNTKLTYYVYDTSVIEDIDYPLTDGEMGADGYLLEYFERAGENLRGTLRLNQKQLYGKDIYEIAGDYSGYMVYTTSIVSLGK